VRTRRRTSFLGVFFFFFFFLTLVLLILCLLVLERNYLVVFQNWFFANSVCSSDFCALLDERFLAMPDFYPDAALSRLSRLLTMPV